MKRNWGIALTGAVIVALIVLVVSNSDALKRTLVEHLADKATEQADAQIGKRLPINFMVTRHSTASAVSLSRLLKPGTVVMLTEANCQACATAMQHYIKHYVTGTALPKNQFFALSFDADSSPPQGFPSAQYLHAGQAKGGTLFDFIVSPVFWQFNHDGQVVEIAVGYSKSHLNALLVNSNSLPARTQMAQTSTLKVLNGSSTSSQ